MTIAQTDDAAEPEAVGVLLPLYLQTRFVPPTADQARWRLQLMVTPDAVFFHDHRRSVSKTELGLLDRLWAQCEGDVSSPAGRQAFDWLAAAVGGGRAAWLVRHHPPAPTSSAVWEAERGAVPITNEGNARNAIYGVPERLAVWLKREGAEPFLVAELAVETSKLTSSDNRHRGWLTSFTAAQQVGLATTFELESPLGIESLFVVGLGDDPAPDLFEAHRDAGQLAVLAAGTATNSVPGRPATDLSPRSDQWWQLAQGLGDDASETLSLAISGSSDALGPVPGPSSPHSVTHDLAVALFPVLFGAPARTLWGFRGRLVAEVADWVDQFLWPEGPLPPIRIDDQPFGLLPATSWSRWNPGPDDPPIEGRMWPHLISFWGHLSDIAAGSGNVVDADSDKLHDLLSRLASSEQFAVRAAEPLQTVSSLLGAWNRPHEHLFDAYSSHPANLLGIEPARALLTTDGGGALSMPLVTPDNLWGGETLAFVLHRLATWDGSVGNEIVEEPHDLARPRSLLYQLLYTALLTAQAEVTREATGVVAPALEPLVSDASDHTRLESDALAYTDKPGVDSPARNAERRVRTAIGKLAQHDATDLERALRATLDTAHHRVDPFLQGAAWRRFREHLDGGARPCLGAYGWVDRPQPGALGPTDGGVVLAPSHDQLVTAVLARDGAVNDPEHWEMQLDSEKVAAAVGLADDTKHGLHLSIALGSRIEAEVDPLQVALLRAKFPLREEDAQRRVCDGLAVIHAPDDDLTSLGLPIGTTVEPLRRAVEAYGDLVLLDGLHRLVQGRSEAAGAAMDGAAGLARPPDLAVVKSADAGDEIATNVLLIWPVGEAAHGISGDGSPAGLAEPTLAALIKHLVRMPLLWQSLKTNNEYRLGDAGLTPADLFVIDRGELERIFARLDGAAPGLRGPGVIAHEALERYAAALQCRPAAGRHHPAANEASHRVELERRLGDLRSMAEAQLTRLEQSEPPEQQALTLASLATWGVRSADGATPQALLTAGREEIARRLDSVDAIAADSGVDVLADALRTLAVGDRPLPQFTMAAGLPSLTPDATVRDEWLPALAPLRKRLAAVEAVALENESPGHELLVGWTNLAGGPWSGRPDAECIILLGPPDALQSNTGTVALGLVDSWTEARPRHERMGHAAFGFEAPPARAPRAILLATPADPDAKLTPKTLIDIVVDTRRLALARAVDPMAVRREASFIPAGFVPQANIHLQHHPAP